MAALASLFATTTATSAGSSAATTAASTAATTAAASSSASSIFTLSNLFSGLSLASMASDIFGGFAEGKAASDQLSQEAQQNFMSAKQDELQGQQQQNDINENLRQTIATQRLAYSGAGIDFSFGTPAKLEKSLQNQAEMQLGTSRDNAMLKSLARRRAGYIALSQRSQAQNAPVIKGIRSAFGTGQDVLKNKGYI